MRMIRRGACWLVATVVLALIALAGVLIFPEPFFAYQVTSGRLTLHSDLPFDPARGRAILDAVEQRLKTSPLDDRNAHGIYIANAEWRRRLFFNIAAGAAGVNFYPVTRNVFLRHSDIDADQLFGASGNAAAPPRTFTYYAAHEITHSLTAEWLGPSRLWNGGLPQWVREGYADYVGMGGKVDIDELYRRCRAGDRDLDFARSGTYARFRMLVAYLLERRHWTVEQLLLSKLSQEEAEALMKSGMAASQPTTTQFCG